MLARGSRVGVTVSNGGVISTERVLSERRGYLECHFRRSFESASFDRASDGTGFIP